MSTPAYQGSRLRTYLEFLAAVVYFFVARAVASRAALGLAGSDWSPLVEQLMLVFLLLVGYASMGFWFDKQMHPITEQGLPRRRGWTREAGMGISVGWGIAVVCVLAMAVMGGIATSFTLHFATLGWFLVDLAFFAIAALVEEIAFRGYGFQRFAHSVGSIGASLGFAAFYAILQARIPGANHASILVGVVLTLLLSAAYVRTRALWVSWGINFAWKASRALIFGLAVSGVNDRSPLVQGDPMGPFWLTGGAYGLDGSWFAFFVLVAALPVVFRVTSDLNFIHNAPVFVPGGVPVDLDEAARVQHEAAMGTAQPAAPTLVQILPAATLPPQVLPGQGKDPNY